MTGVVRSHYSSCIISQQWRRFRAKLAAELFSYLCRKAECYISVIPAPVEGAISRHSGSILITAHNCDSAV